MPNQVYNKLKVSSFLAVYSSKTKKLAFCSLLEIYAQKSECPSITKYSMFQAISSKNGHWKYVSGRFDWAYSNGEVSTYQY